MPGKSVSLSVRLSPEEATFLASYNPPGATTLSEKLRAMIAEAQHNQGKSADFASSLGFYEERMAVPIRRIKEAENQIECHSELLALFAYWLPDAIANFTAKAPAVEDKDLKAKLLNFEAGVNERIFVLIEQVLRLTVTGESPCYDPYVINNRAEVVVKLGELIKLSINQKREK